MKKMIMVLSLLLCLMLMGRNVTEQPEEALRFNDTPPVTEAPVQTEVPVSTEAPTCTPMPTPMLTPDPADGCEHLRTSWQWGKASSVPVDDEKHLMFQQEDLLCGVCGRVVRTGTLRYEEPHRFNTCIMTNCEQVDDEKHLVLQEEALLCRVCDHVVRIETMMRYEEPHKFSTYGECLKCGRIKPVSMMKPSPTPEW